MTQVHAAGQHADKHQRTMKRRAISAREETRERTRNELVSSAEDMDEQRPEIDCNGADDFEHMEKKKTKQRRCSARPNSKENPGRITTQTPNPNGQYPKIELTRTMTGFLPSANPIGIYREVDG